ncbi:Fic/DOC family protein (plasmid) [Legionella sp. D16C41]|uniref:Fic/DOC family protein n=1 Tax=Legionella sp. D16C41 TaxID=3402688 RepID=UPI003AF52E42
MTDKHSNRYAVPEDENFEPGAEEGILKNFLKIKLKDKIEIIEEQELQRTELELLEIFNENHCFTAEDLCNIHELWLGDVYPFAGKYRTVNMEKAGFPFAPAINIAKLMSKFEKEYLSTYTPCHYTNMDELAYALGVVHVEFIIIHPFREGNGRTARLLADLMAMQAKKPPLNYTAIDQTQNPEGFSHYILAIHAGFTGDYSLIKNIFKLLIEQSI